MRPSGIVTDGRRFAGTGMVVDAVLSEPVSGQIPCLTGKKQGIFEELGAVELTRPL